MNSYDILEKIEELRDEESDIEFSIDSKISFEELGRAILMSIGDGRQSFEISSSVNSESGNIEYDVKVSSIRQDYINFCECCQKHVMNIKMSPFSKTCKICDDLFSD